MKQWFHLFFFCLLISGCNNKGSTNGILSMPKMQVVLSDLMKADQFIMDFRIPKDTAMDKDAESIKLYQQVFAIHGTTKTQFEKSLTYYQSHPDLLKVIMDSISKPAIVTPAQNIPSKDPVLKKDSNLLSKDTILLKKDSSILLKKKVLIKNK